MMKRSQYFSLALHVIIWLAVLIVPPIVFHNVKLDTGLSAEFFYISSFYHLGLFYLNAYYLYPRLLNRRRWWLYILSIAAIVRLSYLVKLFLIKLADPAFTLNDFNGRIIFFAPVPFLFASFIFRLIANRIRAEKEEKEKKAEKLASELKFLRSQVSPHFLFNVMTNLVSLARQKSDMLEPTLIRLSDLLRYMLYETNEDKFPLGKEIEYLRNYVELQRLRFGEDVRVEMDIPAEQPSCTIEPMLLIPFVENAFKHGIGLVQDPFIHIKLEVVKEQLLFNVSNKYNKENLSKDKNSGIGLVNVKDRLDLLYGKKYTLAINDNGELYNIALKLELVC